MHERADDALDDARKMRLARRSPLDGDAVLRATALERRRMELGRVVDPQAARLADHGPRRLNAALAQPRRLVAGDQGQTQADPGGRWRIEGQMEAGEAAAEHVNRYREPGSPDR